MVTKYRATHNHQEIRQRQPYETVLEGITLVIDKDVFPPDAGYTGRNLSRVLSHYRPRTALDMGCGSGFLALTMRRLGVPTVWAADIHPLAVGCCRKNCERNSHLLPVTVVQSDLFENIPAELRFDLIVFNQPYFPSTESEFIAGTSDGGSEVIGRFLGRAQSYLTGTGVIIMTIQDTAGTENDPKNVAEQLGLTVKTVFRETEWDINRFIYEISYPARWSGSIERTIER
jgi:release factor glutamine methyltransferase